MVDVTKNTGTTFGMSADLPTTYDDDGYAVPSITDIGEVIDIGELGKLWAVITHQSVTKDYPEKIKDTYDVSDVALTIGRVTANTGQALLQTALASPAHYTFKVVLPSGDIGYFTGMVTKASIGAIATSGVSSTVVTIAIDPESFFET